MFMTGQSNEGRTGDHSAWAGHPVGLAGWDVGFLEASVYVYRRSPACLPSHYHSLQPVLPRSAEHALTELAPSTAPPSVLPPSHSLLLHNGPDSWVVNLAGLASVLLCCSSAHRPFTLSLQLLLNSFSW